MDAHRAMIRRALSLAAFLLVSAPGFADDPSLGPTAAGQSVADALREFAKSDVAIVPAGILKEAKGKDDVSASLAFGGDGVVTIGVLGAKLREALERSVAAYPQSSVGFLQVSGVEATFKKSAPANARLTTVTVNGTKLDDAKTYVVAMPRSLQQGQLGYANLWENSTILDSFGKATLESIVKGRRVGSFVARWSPQG